MTDFTKPITIAQLPLTAPEDAIPKPYQIFGYFKRPYDYHAQDKMFLPYLGAAIDYVRNGHLDLENIKAKSFVNQNDALAHLNYIFNNTQLAIDQKISAIAQCMYQWFEVVPPKQDDDKPEVNTGE